MLFGETVTVFCDTHTEHCHLPSRLFFCPEDGGDMFLRNVIIPDGLRGVRCSLTLCSSVVLFSSRSP
jgi:hypothetical protein